MDPVERIEKATERTARIVEGVKSDQLSDSTPCSELDVRGLLNHVLGGLEMLCDAASGGSPKMPEGDQFGDDPGKEYNARKDKLLVAIRSNDVMTNTWKMPFGEMPGQMMMGIAFVEHVTHGWDIAKATGQDTTIPDNLIAECRRIVEPTEQMWRMNNVLGPAVDVPESASETDRYAGFMGRQP